MYNKRHKEVGKTRLPQEASNHPTHSTTVENDIGKGCGQQGHKNARSGFLFMLFGFLRSGEVVAPSKRCFDPQVHLCYEDIKVDDKKKLHIFASFNQGLKNIPIQTRGPIVHWSHQHRAVPSDSSD